MNDHPWVVARFDPVVEDFMPLAVMPPTCEREAQNLAVHLSLQTLPAYAVQKSWAEITRWLMAVNMGVQLSVTPNDNFDESERSGGILIRRTLYHRGKPVAIWERK